MLSFDDTFVSFTVRATYSLLHYTARLFKVNTKRQNPQKVFGVILGEENMIFFRISRYIK